MNFIDKWFIKEMDMWDKDYIDMEVDGYIEIYDECNGNFQFGLVKGNIIYKLNKVNNKEILKFKFTAVDEFDPVTGTGWMEIIKRGVIKGEFTFDNGDISGFLAKC